MTERVLGPTGSQRRRRTLLMPIFLALLVGLAIGVPSAVGSHPEVSLPGSNFEIETDANLKVDDAGSLDWANVADTRRGDKASGSGDDSFGQGTKEDTPVPTVVNGSIPPNKSDLLNFGVYLETTSSGASFMNLFWHRVQEPSGTTNMDFEFNQSSTISGNGVTPVRTAGDLLVQYDLSQGGTNPVLFLSRWVTSGPASQCQASNSVPCWGTKTNLTAAGDATGSINTSAIPAGESDGLGAISPRTFGEAQLDFDALGGADACTSFGSAYLKSRSSDSFTAALKDFIAPTPLDINNCGAIEITKTRKHAADGTGDHPHAGVDFVITGGGLPEEGTTITTNADGIACLDGLLLSSLAGGDYTVTETVPAGYNASPGSATVTVDTEATCEDDPYVGETASFSNTPLTNVTVSVDSQVAGGTSSTIDCDPTNEDLDAGPGDDISVTLSDLEPTTLTCTIFIDP